MPGKKENKEPTLAEVLQKYGRQSAGGLERMGDEFVELVRSVPPEYDELAGTVAEYLPGYAAYESVQHGDLASRAYNEGNYGDAMMEFANGMDKASDSLMWFLPGAGLVRLPK